MTEPSPPPVPEPPQTPAGWAALAADIRTWARELGFTATGISGVDLGADEQRLMDWLAAGFHGDMDYMARHGTLRARPAELVPGTLRVLSARIDYWPGAGAVDAGTVLADGTRAYVARYALGRDYHRIVRPRLARLAQRIEAVTGPFVHRAFADSAPILEKPLAARAGLGWVGKHSNLLARDGSWFLLGELCMALPLPVDAPQRAHCGRCTACIDVCPTQAIVAPYVVDARRCLSYLSIEHHGPIPTEFRRAFGNRIMGCDDCQLFCPWNRHAQPAIEPDFRPRHGLDGAGVVELFGWDEATWLARSEGMALRRLGYGRWLRNLAVALGNAPASHEVVAALEARAGRCGEVVNEHIAWALAEQAEKAKEKADAGTS